MTRLDPSAVDRLLAGVEAADADARTSWPGPDDARQPAHVLYVPADRVMATTVRDAGDEATRLLRRHAPTPADLAVATGMVAGDLADQVHDRVASKLAHEPVEDLRVDFEDGYLGRDQTTEARDAEAAARALGEMVVAGTAPPFLGLRVKSFTDGLARRSVATLDRFLDTLLDTAGELPTGFLVTFPKIVSTEHVAAFADVLAALEDAHGLPAGCLVFEVQLETPASMLGPRGEVALRGIQDAGAGRLRAVHLGIFDYTAALGLPVEEQRLDHPACDLARHLAQVTFAQTHVWLSDGSTNVRPADDTTEEVRRVWRIHAGHVRHSLAHGFVQGWDLHPAHLVSRWAAVYAHLLTGLDEVIQRLAAWQDGAVGGSVMDEPATVRILARRLRRAVACGAIKPDAVDPVWLESEIGHNVRPLQ